MPFKSHSYSHSLTELPASPSESVSAAFANSLRTRLSGFGTIEWADSTPSTNQDLILRARQGVTESNPLPWLRGARQQTAGKGRAGRPWKNTTDATLMFSCAFAPDIPLAQLPGLSPALGVAACEALRQLAGTQIDDRETLKLGLKWPNDLQWDKHSKLAGILVETAPTAGHKHPVIVAGIGINLRGARQLSQDLGRPIADWSDVTRSDVSVDTALNIVSAISQAWQQAILVYAKEGFAAFVERYAQVDDLQHVEVNLLDQDKVLLSGTACGTDVTGRLQVRTAKGLIPVMTGDISVRPVS